VISLLLGALSAAITRDRGLLEPGVSEQDMSAIFAATTPTLGFYVGVIVLAIFAPRVAPFGYLAIAVVAVLRAHGDKTPATPASA
jgi:hypothetical protein